MTTAEFLDDQGDRRPTHGDRLHGARFHGCGTWSVKRSAGAASSVVSNSPCFMPRSIDGLRFRPVEHLTNSASCN